ncbi:TRAP-type C4-dicarboxylate transport system, periplasmic component [Schinkia azotoformans MEV2011]|uniref:TRAP-type C4-dicarboxylate transport system, periplasmic component n=1 Tax=Schinkia azotoformans MEV2011 TaxID=1348973 RepID=A0A072P0B3_SCHAZ|nr:TRAP transporter substrate-binding protein [Schinkia azotoformans]KEF38940.1 TRAP-type C4-dicarboxylate transport system, periplasmic component [Schinkia azotoformans MEV2011]MEC1694497.1 TRAP transporter substrate-binding protein [Schinkia azotoformans]MEC1714536.1 TRAP transporter substrate-binding protein [Schinkia azotoformans]MEC1723307.1 TRAP transporter substrate-binding protein [Schinkia azotoformans]MEC1740370.1 TRAP transporter substrate-binding protein [Schinkia azotoformans]
MRKGILFSLIALMMLFMAACSSTSSGNQSSGNESSGEKSADVIELNYAFFAPAGTFPAVQMEKWAEELEKRTNNKVKVNTFPGGTLLTAENMYDGVANGLADIGLSSTTYEPGRFPLLAVSDMPSGYPNAKVASKVIADLVNEYTPEAFKDFKIITTFASEPAYIQSQQPIESLEDLKGKQLRISGATTDLFKELGAAPVGMSQSEVAEALQTGIVNGYVSSREVLKDMKYAEMVKYITDYPLTVNTFVAVMNKSKWDSLPEDVKTVIDELNTEMTDFTGDYLDNYVGEVLKWSEDEHSIKTVPLKDSENWTEIGNKLQLNAVKKAEEAGLPGQEYQNRLKELVEKYSQEQ